MYYIEPNIDPAAFDTDIHTMSAADRATLAPSNGRPSSSATEVWRVENTEVPSGSADRLHERNRPRWTRPKRRFDLAHCVSVYFAERNKVYAASKRVRDYYRSVARRPFAIAARGRHRAVPEEQAKWHMDTNLELMLPSVNSIGGPSETGDENTTTPFSSRWIQEYRE